MASLDRFLANHPAINRQGNQNYTKAIWGGIAQEFDAMKGSVDSLIDESSSIDIAEGNRLDELVLRLTKRTRLYGQDDEKFRRFVKLLFQRNGNISFQTKWAILDVFKYFFSEDSLYVVENWTEGNLFDEGDFEGFEVGEKEEQFGQWVPSGSSVAVESGDSFSGDRNVLLSGDGALYQDVECASGCYILLVPHRGNGVVTVERESDSKQWDFSSKTWDTSASMLLSNQGSRYEISEQPIILDDDDTVRITFSTAFSLGTFRMDYVILDKKPSYPYIAVLCKTSGQGDDYVNSWPNGEDPLSGVDYDNSTFIGIDFLGGAGGGFPVDYLRDILDLIKTAGVKATFSYVEGF